MVLGLRIGTEEDNPPFHVLVGDRKPHYFRVKAPHLHQIVTKQSDMAQTANLWHTRSLPSTCLTIRCSPPRRMVRSQGYCRRSPKRGKPCLRIATRQRAKTGVSIRQMWCHVKPNSLQNYRAVATGTRLMAYRSGRVQAIGYQGQMRHPAECREA